MYNISHILLQTNTNTVTHDTQTNLYESFNSDDTNLEENENESTISNTNSKITTTDSYHEKTTPNACSYSTFDTEEGLGKPWLVTNSKESSDELLNDVARYFPPVKVSQQPVVKAIYF